MKNVPLQALSSLLFILAASCGTKRNPEVCHFEPCLTGFVCNAEQRCVPVTAIDAMPDAAVDTLGPNPMDQAIDTTNSDVSGWDAMGTCGTSADCKQPNAPLCVAGTCVACGQAGSGTCAQANATTPFCAATGACVGCLAHSDCPTASPICGPSSECTACNAANAPADGCGKRDPGKTVCAKVGGTAGQCVGCVEDVSCVQRSAPICDKTTNACRRCGLDSECITKEGADPGVCMSHDDGRCATAAETVKTQNGDLQAAISSATAGGKKLVVVAADSDRAVFSGPGKLAIVGKGLVAKPAIGGGTKPALTVSGGELFLRDLLITNSTPGLTATNAALLRMKSCDVTGNTGGMLLDGASFEIESSEISDNKIGTFGTSKWGGILVNNPGTPKRLSQVKILNNKQTGVVCSAPVTLDRVTATGNVPENVAPECQ